MWSLHIKKDSNKFSAAHFTIFDSKHAERLHGHNYYVELSLENCKRLNNGMVVDIAEPKSALQEVLGLLDERVLIPTTSPYLNVKEVEKNIDLEFGDKKYSFPKTDCILIEANNITIESLSEFVATSLLKAFEDLPIESFSITLQETSGQSCTYKKYLETKLL